MIIICLGCFINGVYNKRLPLIVGFVAGFVMQVIVRMLVFQTPLLAMLAPGDRSGGHHLHVLYASRPGHNAGAGGRRWPSGFPSPWCI